ncbi:hypothetical protein BJ741DRAFT_636960, partial [Chytriomyces cf. hyalinus JEL632]
MLIPIPIDCVGAMVSASVATYAFGTRATLMTNWFLFFALYNSGESFGMLFTHQAFFFFRFQKLILLFSCSAP